MAVLSCSHESSAGNYQICTHLLESKKVIGYYRFFTGVGKTYHLICQRCAKELDILPTVLQPVCKGCFDKIEGKVSEHGNIGRPEVYFEKTSLDFEHQQINFPGLKTEPLLEVQPLLSEAGAVWIGVTAAGVVVRIDCENSELTPIFQLSPDDVDLSSPLELVISLDGKWGALANLRKTRGVVVDLIAGRRTMFLSREDYHADFSSFPLAFWEYKGRTLLIHGTEWNRLDISDPATGVLLTPREPTQYVEKVRPEHYLDYFHGRLMVSPDQNWIVDDGWVWHPWAVVAAWNLPRWLEENVWESEDGPSLRSVSDFPCWDMPMGWLGDHILALWGYGNDESSLISAVRWVDLSTGAPVDWFPGPEIASMDEDGWWKGLGHRGTLIFDRFLFSVSEKYGTMVWDMDRGMGVLKASEFVPHAYHSGSHTFLTVLPEGNLRLSRLVERKK